MTAVTVQRSGVEQLRRIEVVSERVGRPVLEPLLAVLVAALATASVLGRIHLPAVTPTLGMLAAVGAPSLLFFRLNPARWRDRVDRLLISVALAVLFDLAVGVALNGIGPLLGRSRPLTATGIVAATDAALLLLAGVTFSFAPAVARRRLRVPATTGTDLALLSGGAGVVVLAVAGAIRLDNGLGGGVTHAGLGLACVVMTTGYALRRRTSAGVLETTLYLLALGLLLMTSLRGAYTTGHDVQHEMFVFRQTSEAAHWVASRHDAYNACLSITVLPTLLQHWTGVSDVMVFKVLTQLLYALVPVLVYRFVLRFTTSSIAIVSTIWFVGFVGFLQDMPMLNRQEIGFLFFLAAVMTLYVGDTSVRARRIWFVVFAAGMVTTHYSTTYFAIGSLAAAYGLQLLYRLLLSWRVHAPGTMPRLAIFRVDPRGAWPLSALVLIALAAGTFAWTTAVTHTSSGVMADVRAAVDAAIGRGSDARSPEANFALLPVGSHVDATRAYADLDHLAGDARNRDPGAYYADAPSGAGRLPEVPQRQQPLTALGRDLQQTGLDVNDANRAIRIGLGIALQLLLVIGMLTILFARRRLPVQRADITLLGTGMVILTVVQLALPALSLQYGVGRSFMQSLMVLGPVVVIGSRSVFAVLRRGAMPAAAALGVFFLASSTGVLTQATGGYYPQLHLNVAGDYFDRYYTSAADVATLNWLSSHVIAGQSTYPNIQMDPSMYNKSLSIFPPVTPLRASTTIYPSVINKDSYVVLGGANVAQQKTEITVDGYELWYRYPLEFLDAKKNLVYATGSTRVYR